MPVITISRQYGSGGSEIAQRLARRLGWSLIDNEFVDRVAQRAGLPPQEVASRQERVPGLIERLAGALAISSPEVFVATGEAPSAGLDTEERLVRATEAVIAQAVREEQHLILVGRGAQAYLAERTDTLHVYVVAPRDARIEAVMQRLGLDREAAAEEVDRTDEGRRRYVKTHYGRKWEDAANYHLVVNTGFFGIDECVDLIAAAVRTKGWSG